MRVLLLLRGSAGVGKSTWIEQHGLKPYTLSADDIRTMCFGAVLNPDGTDGISQSHENEVWRLLFQMLETRMRNGEFTVIDATNSKTSEMNQYKDMCETYKYRIYCVDFTDVPIEVVKERNRNREPLKRVPEDVIDKMYSRFKTQKIPSGIKVIKPDELDTIWMRPLDLSEYKKIHVIGDIHGCYTALSEYFDGEGGMRDDEFYIFCGDYLDRGIENAEVLKFLLSLASNKNVMFLEGNHEIHLWAWANEGYSHSKEFELHTRAQLEDAQIDKKEVRRFYRHIGQCAYYTYHGNTYLVTHGGLSRMPENLTKIATFQMIRGVGAYNDAEMVAASFAENAPENTYQIFGHRNPKRLPTKMNDKVFCLNGDVENGGTLRCVQLLQDGTNHVVEIQNHVVAVREEPDKSQVRSLDGGKSIEDLILELRQNRYISEKRYGNISSFNFTKSAFYDKVWDAQTEKARGLYINIPKAKVIARAYDKFFNINERAETKFETLQYRLKFPVTAYVKENGFLGIVAYNEETDDLFVTTKSSPDGIFAEWFKNILYDRTTEEVRERMKEFSKENNVSFVFECVDMQNDPHIIPYPQSTLFLLDIVFNDMNYRKVGFDSLCKVADEFGFQHKEKAYVLESWQDFFDWYYMVLDEDYRWNDRRIEGFVIEDDAGLMVKLKLTYYNFWKFMRSIAHETLRIGHIPGRRTSALTTPLANEFYAWCRKMHDTGEAENLPRDICTLRKLFLQSEEGKAFAD